MDITGIKDISECSILVVDDDEAVCDLLSEALAPHYRVATAFSVYEASLLLGEDDYDLVIADLVLPDGSGMDVLANAKSRDEFVEVMIITGKASLESAAAAVNAGVGCYLQKPFPVPELLSRVEKLLALRQFHLRSLQLMQHSDLAGPAVRGHVDDITSLYNFTRKLTLTLEISEVMRITLEEVNRRTGAAFCSIGVSLLDYADIYSMPLEGEMAKERIEEIFTAHWGGVFAAYMDREKWDRGGIAHYVYNGRKGERRPAASAYRCLNFPLIVIGKTIGSLAVWSAQDAEIDSGLNRYLHVLASVASPVIEHVYMDLQARFQAKTDGLTGIANHRQFYESLEREIARANRRKNRFALVLADIDNFKSINDAYGHQTGDAVIVDMTRRLTAGVRTGDIPARYGGEEFGLILPDAELDGARALANRVCESIAGTPFRDSKHEIPYTASFGLAMYDGDSPITKDELVSRADKALYKSKHAGKNQVTIAD